MDRSYYTPNLGINSSSSAVEFSSHIGGNLVSVRRKKNYQNTKFPTTKAPRNWKRGKCKGQSKSSRNRFQRDMNRINRGKLTEKEKFITLTYENPPDDWQVVKNHLHRFQKWMLYHYPKSTGYWKLENQDLRSSRANGKICWHFHFLVYNLAFLPNKKLNGWWNKTTGSKVKQRTDVENVRSQQDIHNYLIKYISKRNLDEKFQNTEMGRTWGKFRRGELAKLIDENVVNVVDDYVDPDTGKTTTKNELEREFRKIVLRYKDSYSRRKWGKKYKKDYHYSIRKFVDEKVVDVDFRQKKSKGYMVLDVRHHLKPDRMWILWDDATLDKVLDHITGFPPKRTMKQVLQDWNRREL